MSSPMPRALHARLTRQAVWRSPWAEDAVRRSVTVTRWPVWVRSLKGLPGVYLIRDAETKRVVYVGRSRVDVKKALVRHFHAWGEDPRGQHCRQVFDRRKVEVKVLVLRCAAWAAATEAECIERLQPSENRRAERAALPDDDDIPF